MRKLLILSLFFLCVFSSVAASQDFWVYSNGSSTVYYSSPESACESGSSDSRVFLRAFQDRPDRYVCRFQTVVNGVVQGEQNRGNAIRVASSSSSAPDCAPHLSKNSEGYCVCPNEGTQVNTGNQCDSTCPAGHDTSGMCYPENCPWGEGTPAQCNDRSCSNEGHKSVEMLPGMWMCVKEIPDENSSSSSGNGDDNDGGSGGDGDGGSGGDGGDGGDGGVGQSSSSVQQCPAGTAWGNVGGFWDCWSGWPDNNNGDCPEGQTWGSVNGVQGCWGQSGNCPPGQSYGVVNGVLGCHGQPIQSCPNGQIWGSVNGVQGCYGAPSCPAGFTHGTVNGVTTCWNNSGCDAVGNCASSRASSSAPNCPNGQVWNGAQCQLPTSSSASSSGSGDGDGDGDGDGNNSSDGSGNGGGSGGSASSAASSSCPEGQECNGGGGTGEWPEPGGFCEEGEECNSLTMEGVLGDFMEGITSAEIIASMDEFLTVDGGGSCPVWNVSVWVFALVIDQFCSPHIPWGVIRGVILFVASVISFRIAFT